MSNKPENKQQIIQFLFYLGANICTDKHLHTETAHRDVLVVYGTVNRNTCPAALLSELAEQGTRSQNPSIQIELIHLDEQQQTLVSHVVKYFSGLVSNMMTITWCDLSVTK